MRGLRITPLASLVHRRECVLLCSCAVLIFLSTVGAPLSLVRHCLYSTPTTVGSLLVDQGEKLNQHLTLDFYTLLVF
jgi:hypothetical protein